jgi:predicted lipoprotein
MKKTVIAGGLITVMVLGGCRSTTESEVSRAETTGHISQAVYAVELQSAQALLTESEALAQAFSAYCVTKEMSIGALKQQWHQTMMAWMALQGQERGPATALEQSWKVQFWPDKKNTTGRKMSALTKVDTVWSTEHISQQSVTVQGLGALEWLLYDAASSLENRDNTCATGVSIAENLSSNAQIIAGAWDTNPWTGLRESEWESEYVSLLSNQLDYSMKKLSRPLAKIGQPRPYFSESWRSETSFANLKANLKSLEALYHADGKGLDALLRAKGHRQLADRIAGQFSDSLQSWPEKESLFATLKTKAGYRMVLSQYNKLEYLKYMIQEEVAIELGVIIGFNATDGD